MYNSIKYFEENYIKKFKKLEDNFMKKPKDMAEYLLGLTSELHNLGLEMIKDYLEAMNQMLIDSPIRLRHWVVECHSKK